jgi:carboxyl-terminal processing protease
MTKTFLLAIAILLTANLIAQPLQKASRDAFMISRMVEKYHVQPRALDDNMSAALYTQILESLDEQRIFFIQEDITKLSAWKGKLDEEIKTKQSAFLQTLTSMYKLRLQQADTMIDNISKTPFNFTVKEKLTVAEDTAYAATVPALRSKLYKLLKLTVLNSIIEYAEETTSKSPSKKLTDSLEPILRKKSTTGIKRSIRRILQNPGGFENQIGAVYCQSLASCYDPHTAYFPPAVKEAFEGHLGKKSMSFGLTFDEDEDGNVEIDHLKPGSGAFQSGQLNKGDRIQAVQYENKEPIDVSTAELKEIEQMLANANASKVILTVKKADGTTRQVTLRKERVDVEEDDKVKSFILQGSKKIGFISLPAFYSDWENTEGVNGCANDVAKEILKLKRENIDGLILDLRYNGGGSMQEAIALAGIFIDAGPVAQIKTRDAKVLTLKDGNRGTVYDGPLLLLVNGFSASASEMVAATLQDYNRAIIAGSPTYGKATAQVVLPMDTTINIETYNGKANSDGYVKMTISKLYRLNGTTAQAHGVQPDILLPDMVDAIPQREVNEKYAIPATTIEANKYYKPLTTLPVSSMSEQAKKDVESSDFYKEIVQFINKAKAGRQPKDYPLSADEAWQQHMLHQANTEQAGKETSSKSKAAFTVTNHSFELQRLRANPDLQEMNDEWQDHLLNDPYISTVYKLLALMIRPGSH